MIQTAAAARSAQVAKNLARGVCTGAAGESRTRMRAGTAEVQPANRRAVLPPAEQRPHRQQLFERELAVEDVSAGEAVRALEIERCDHLHCHDGRCQPWCMPL